MAGENSTEHTGLGRGNGKVASVTGKGRDTVPERGDGALVLDSGTEGDTLMRHDSVRMESVCRGARVTYQENIHASDCEEKEGRNEGEGSNVVGENSGTDARREEDIRYT